MESLKQFKDMDEEELISFVHFTMSNVGQGDIPEAIECAKDYLARGGVPRHHDQELTNKAESLLDGKPNRLKMEWIVGQLLDLVETQRWHYMYHLMVISLIQILGGIHPHSHKPGMFS